MAKKPTPSTQRPTRSTPIATNSQQDKPASNLLFYLMVLAITALTYLPSLKNGLVNWDDDPNITENPNLERVGKGQSLSETFKLVFDEKTGNVIGNYNPLPIFTFALEKAWVGGEFGPKLTRLIHTDNLILHLLTVLFSMRVLSLLGVGRWGIALGGLLMGVHAMRVESVAWATERKDVLFAVFFFAALEVYIRYVKAEQNKKILLFVLWNILGMLSLYSKVQAVTLVVSMGAIDYLIRRPFSFQLILEKLLLLGMSVMIGLTNLRTLAAQGSTNDDLTGFSAFDRFCVGSWSFCVYLYKLLIPHPMSPLYPYPKPLEVYHKIAPVFFLGAIAVGIWLLMKNKRNWAFALGFFSLNVVLLLQFFGAGQGYLADRFTYVPYFGFFFIAAFYFDRWYQQPGTKSIATIGASILILIHIILTVKQIGVWENGFTLWSHVMKYEGRTNSLPYWNRGQYLRNQGAQLRDSKQTQAAIGKYEEALRDYTEAVTINSRDPELFNSRGKTYFDMATTGLAPKGREAEYLTKAVADYNQAIEKASAKPKTQSEAYINRGAAKGAMGDNQAALIDLSKGIEIDPKNKNGYFNRSIVNYTLQRFGDALNDYTSYLELDPFNANILYERGMLQRSSNKNSEAIADLSKAISIKNDFGLAFLERARAYAQSGNKAAAQADYQRAQQLGYPPNSFDKQLMGN